jgi:hypothetical protein
MSNFIPTGGISTMTGTMTTSITGADITKAAAIGATAFGSLSKEILSASETYSGRRNSRPSSCSDRTSLPNFDRLLYGP